MSPLLLTVVALSTDSALERNTVDDVMSVVALSTDSALERNTVDDVMSDEEPDSTILADNFATMNNGKSLLFFYDCETTGGSHLQDYRVGGTS